MLGVSSPPPRWPTYSEPSVSTTTSTRLGRDRAGRASALPASPSRSPAHPLTATARPRQAHQGAHARQRHASVLLVIDQLEELFTLGAEPRSRRGPTPRSLARAARSARDPVRVVADPARRFPDSRRPGCPGFATGWSTAWRSSPLPSPRISSASWSCRPNAPDTALRTRDLPRDMVAEVADHPAALALLSFAAARLWEHPRSPFPSADPVGLSRHRRRGRCAGQTRRNSLFNELPRETSGPSCAEILGHLVTSAGTRARRTREELMPSWFPIASTRKRPSRPSWPRASWRPPKGRDLAMKPETPPETSPAANPRASPRVEPAISRSSTRPCSRPGRACRAGGARAPRALACAISCAAAARQWVDHGRHRGQLWRGDILAELRLWQARAGPASSPPTSGRS